MEDNRILDLFFERSEQAIGEVSKKYGGILRRTAWNIVHDQRDAEECVSDTWLSLWNTIPPKRPEPLLSYALRITRNLAVGCLRRNTAQKRSSPYDVALVELEDCLAAPSGPEDLLDAKELGRSIDRFLDTLDKKSRVAFVRRYWFADSVQDIASILGLSPNAVTLRLRRSREKLKQYLMKEGIAV